MQQYTFDQKSGRYRDQNGFVPKRKIEAFKKRVQKKAIADVKASSQKYQDKEIGLEQLQRDIRDAIRRGTVAIAGIESGGVSTQNPTMLSVGRHLQVQYKYLDLVFNGHRSGKVSDAQLANRLVRYAFDTSQGSAIAIHDRNQTYCYRSLADCEHCPECIRYHAMGVKTKGELPPPGVRCACTSRCKCTIYYFETLEAAVKARG
jgi:hypothetical protein